MIWATHPCFTLLLRFVVEQGHPPTTGSCCALRETTDASRGTMVFWGAVRRDDSSSYLTPFTLPLYPILTLLGSVPRLRLMSCS